MVSVSSSVKSQRTAGQKKQKIKDFSNCARRTANKEEFLFHLLGVFRVVHEGEQQPALACELLQPGIVVFDLLVGFAVVSHDLVHLGPRGGSGRGDAAAAVCELLVIEKAQHLGRIVLQDLVERKEFDGAQDVVRQPPAHVERHHEVAQRSEGTCYALRK